MKRFVAVATGVALCALTSTAHAFSTSRGCLPGSVKTALGQLDSHFGGIKVISTHRPGARIAGSGRISLHASCRAADFRPPPGRYREVVAWLRNNFGGEVITYRGPNAHIHIGDNGGRTYASASRKRSRVYAVQRRENVRYVRNMAQEIPYSRDVLN